jgi:hypothetical protein
MSEQFDCAGRHRSRAAMPGSRAGRSPRNKGTALQGIDDAEAFGTEGIASG